MYLHPHTRILNPLQYQKGVEKNVESMDVDNPFAQWDIHNIHDCLTNNNKNVSINLN